MRFCPMWNLPDAGSEILCGVARRSTLRCSAEPAVNLSLRSLPITAAFVGVFLAIMVVGLLAAGWVMLRKPAQTASDSAPAAAPGSATNAMAGTAGNAAPGQLPPGHPKVQLPAEARTFIESVEKDAQAHPNDVAAWNKLGGVSTRAAMFDHSYYAKASDAYGHVLKIDPDNLEALRGIGDVDYDQDKFDQAIAAYEHYLKKKPDDPEVITDLGTMYLYTGNADQAVVQYHKALKIKPNMFQTYFNMGIAYAQQDKPADAQAALKKAEELAPDDTARKQVKEVVAKITGRGGQQMASNAASSRQRHPPQAHFKDNRIDGATHRWTKGRLGNGPPDHRKSPDEQLPDGQMPIAKNVSSDLKSGIDQQKDQQPPR